MPHLPIASLIALTVLLASSADAQWLNYPTPGVPRSPDGKPVLRAPAPRLADGHPDLTGMWGDECMNGTPCFQDKNRFFDIERGLPPGTVQLTDWATAVQLQRLARNKIDDP